MIQNFEKQRNQEIKTHSMYQAEAAATSNEHP